MKVAFDFEFEEYENTVEGLFEFKMTGMKMVTPVEKPADARTFTLKDLEGLVKQPNYITEPSLREIELEDDLYDDSVSYTHLDVYKRQGLIHSRRVARSAARQTSIEALGRIPGMTAISAASSRCCKTG